MKYFLLVCGLMVCGCATMPTREEARAECVRYYHSYNEDLVGPCTERVQTAAMLQYQNSQDNTARALFVVGTILSGFSGGAAQGASRYNEQGCCSYHGGILQNQVHYYGATVECADFTDSPTCTWRN
jgi:hypothetical protein